MEERAIKALFVRCWETSHSLVEKGSMIKIPGKEIDSDIHKQKPGMVKRLGFCYNEMGEILLSLVFLTIVGRRQKQCYWLA